MTAKGDLLLCGQRPEDVYSALTAKGVSEAEATKIVGEWILHTGGFGTRTFTYANPVSPTLGPNCTPHFVRSFVHQDWVDGVSVVQAGRTTGEEGFNDRLHRIENDLDALAADTKRLFECLGELRSAVAQAFTEVANELNFIDQQLSGKSEPPHVIGEGGGIVKSAPQYIGTTTYFGKPVNVWQTDQGMLTVPALQVTQPSVDPLVSNTGNFAKFAEAHPELSSLFSGGKASVESIVNRFGSDTIDASGTTVKEALGVLPPGAEYQNVAELSSGLAAANAAVLRATGRSGAAVATSFTDLGSGIQNVSNAPVARLQGVPTQTATALSAAGITTVGALAGASATQVQQALTTGGVTTSLADAASLAATAKTLASLG
jgi:hypothetical protein